ncbi:Gx transporter family protein [Parasporobacterium paucivorans]|uniref:Heptaprenyl diphosphate synthase n=1 Tax=Parasporobacterium paucivorans DSM 15970 TaxID=1122934 RepID=A0A1M6AC09_9FIRM|nr:Gx transporter family protein [Parasporobacterium paucivorans]SHI34050.1 heptaprenyl diphosphate synthase [Parasporobacterium paucivorans DSM 15970]
MAKRISYLSMFTAFAIILSYIEVILPFNFGIPGVKLGLANLVVVIVLFNIGPREAMLINIVRIFIIALLFGNPFSLLFSFAGAFISFVFMFLAMKSKLFSIIAVSVVGGVTHNIAQIVIASLVVETYGILYYLPVLIIAGFVTGLVLGIIANLFQNKVKTLLRQV